MSKTRHLLHLAKIYINYILKNSRAGNLPVRLWVELSSRCNLKCRLCINRKIPSSLKGDMDPDLFKKIIDGAKEYIHDIYLFHRGEPLLHPELTRFISYASKSSVKTRIHTNATLLDPGLSKKIIFSGLDLISFSFDGYSKDTYEKNRAGADYRETLDNIITFLKIKKQYNLKKPFTVLQVMEFDERLSREDLKGQKKNFIANFKGLPLDRLIVRTPHNWGGLLETGGLKEPGRKELNFVPCTFPWYSLTIFHDGKVYACPQDFEGRMPIGDINSDSIAEIFNSEAIKNIRKSFKTAAAKKADPCSRCDRIWRKTFMGIPKEYLAAFLKDNFRTISLINKI